MIGHTYLTCSGADRKLVIEKEPHNITKSEHTSIEKISSLWGWSLIWRDLDCSLDTDSLYSCWAILWVFPHHPSEHVKDTKDILTPKPLCWQVNIIFWVTVVSRDRDEFFLYKRWDGGLLLKIRFRNNFVYHYICVAVIYAYVGCKYDL